MTEDRNLQNSVNSAQQSLIISKANKERLDIPRQMLEKRITQLENKNTALINAHIELKNAILGINKASSDATTTK